MSHSTRYDIIIIGTGSGGGTLAYRLAPSGKKIFLRVSRRMSEDGEEEVDAVNQ